MMLDMEKFGLRRFMEQLVGAGECTVHSDPIDLVDVAAILDGNEGGLVQGRWAGTCRTRRQCDVIAPAHRDGLRRREPGSTTGPA